MYYQQGYRPPQPPKQSPKVHPSRVWLWVILGVLAVAAIAGGAVYGLQTRERIRKAQEAHQALVDEVESFQDVFLPNIYVDGIHLGGMSAQEGINAVLSQIDKRQNSWSLDLTYQKHVFITLTYATLGIQTDAGQVYALLQQLFEKGKIGTLEERKQAKDELSVQPYHAYTTQSDMTDEHLDQILAQIKTQMTHAPVDAYLAYFYPDLDDPFIIQNEIYGTSLNTDEIKAQILERASAGQSGSLELVPEYTAPKVTAADVRKQVSLLCRATTPISSTSTPDRTSNIRTSLARVNGKTVAPGKRFSFNNVTLARTLKNGYKYAIEYQTGLEVMGIGGGVCQASTTVYLAALQSGLDIVSRTSHSDQVAYTTFGQDATVVYGRLDLVFKNNTSGTLYITAHVNEVKKNHFETEVCIYGPSLGDNVHYSLRTETVETMIAPLNPTYQPDTEHTYVTYKDEEPYLIRKARDGFINETFLQKWENGVLVSETLVSRDTCKPREEVYLTGTLNRD